MNSGLLNGLTSTAPRTGRAVLTRRQTLSAARQAQSLANLGLGRASLSAEPTRNNNTLSNTGLSALDISLAAASRYRITCRLYLTVAATANTGGWQIGFNWPTLTALSGGFVAAALINGTPLTIEEAVVLYPDFESLGGGSGAAVVDSGATVSSEYGSYIFTFDVTTNGAGTFQLLVAQSVTDADVTTIGRNTSVEWVKF